MAWCDKIWFVCVTVSFDLPCVFQILCLTDIFSLLEHMQHQDELTELAMDFPP